jgi:FtsP/CotA-like multicopper oxidase with cupredoxin domain
MKPLIRIGWLCGAFAHRPAGPGWRGGGMDDPQTHDHDDHMFHIHTNPFQVVEVSGQSQADRPWRDTAVVPRPAKGGSIVIRSRFLDYTGVFMLHCHMMNHEEMGMMQTVEVYK